MVTVVTAIAVMGTDMAMAMGTDMAMNTVMAVTDMATATLIGTMAIGTTRIGAVMADGGAAIGTATASVRAGAGHPADMSGFATSGIRLMHSQGAGFGRRPLFVPALSGANWGTNSMEAPITNSQGFSPPFDAHTLSLLLRALWRTVTVKVPGQAGV